jgi:hypothetical protein
LALTKDASDVEYKALVEQLGFKSKTNLKSVCAELWANLKAQGWTKDGSDLITPALFNTEAATGRRCAHNSCEAGQRRERRKNDDRGPRVGRKVSSI